ncbi:PEP-CTERM sorting domain-containing protein [Pseudanabaena sp. FACHB-2040]|uniref:PEP-CTERM sorting domain-containing protein n=1 Tax=Pseudanabaena sp. FACHB-2040 TaxID=2692859 RepID=UPI0016853D04|nr:PEP-CTERM sorting domain-containing protein [Pseudanabaena sp. FACHB-2040]MBD2260555.1 PEP-CTERM sorting domain-containing protein [Pseudanabaena sp. FACHB-2040]
MKHFALAAVAALGFSALATPANAAIFAWDVEYTGWWEEEGGGSISGTFSAREEDALDGIVSIDEMLSWIWNWSGNSVVPAFSIASSGAGTTDFDPSFYVNGTPNQPIGLDLVDLDGLDQGFFTSASGNEVLDLQALLVISYADDGTEFLATGNSSSTLGAIAVSDPTPVPEPATLLGLLALVGAGAATLQRQKQAV